MPFAEQISAALEGARSRERLHELSNVVAKAHDAGTILVDDAERLWEAIQARRVVLFPEDRPASAGGSPAAVSAPPGRRVLYPPRRRQRSPDWAASRERRRRLSLSGPLPSGLREGYTEGERAVLKIVADEVREHGRCDRSLAEIAARAGVCRSLAQATLRLAARDGLLRIEERPRDRQRSLTNVIRIISREWLAWIKGGPRAGGGGSRILAPTDEIDNRNQNRTGAEEKKGCRGAGAVRSRPSQARFAG